MKRIKKTIKAIIEIIKNPWLLNNVLADDIVWDNYLRKKYQLSSLPLVEIDELIPNFSETLECVAFLDGGSLPTDIALLKSLSKKFKNCKYFEIGTWRGESVINVAEISEECYTLNLSEIEMQEKGLSKQYGDLLGFFSKGKNNITHLHGNSLNYDFKAINRKFDLIFIDGDHHYEYVKNDTEKIFKHLMHDNTIVVWHDYAYDPEKIRPEVLAAILDGIPSECRNNLYHVSNTMCAIFTKEEFKTSMLQAPMTPNKKFRIKIECQNL